MTEKLQAIRGMNDILPEQVGLWQLLEEKLRDLLEQYAYQEIRLPLVESTHLFKRSVGEATDIVEKEMYTFTDHNGDSLTLRPEGTAVCVRAGIQHSLFYGNTPRLWYMGPMFRHERPQKGRYRQFYQLGVEAFGMVGPDIDAELLLMTHRLWRELGIAERVHLEINSLGSTAARKIYRDKLVAYFSAHLNQLDEDSQRRLQRNPLRILDSKNPAMQTVIANAPRLADSLDAESAQHFQQLCHLLDQAGIAYKVNPRLVRGLDYYNGTVFEWVTDELGAQGTICAGGHYDGLVEQLGGKACPAIGFAMGFERVLELLTTEQEPFDSGPDFYLVNVGVAEQQAVLIAERIRDLLPIHRLQLHCGGGNLKNQLKKADKVGAKIALIFGDDELEHDMITVKFLREQGEQVTLTWPQLAEIFS